MDVLTFLIKDEPFWRIKKIYSFPSPKKQNKTGVQILEVGYKFLYRRGPEPK